MGRDSEYGALHTEVELEASYGYDNMAKGGRYLPVYVTLTNQREGEFAGTLQVLSMESDYRIYQYEFPVQLKGKETSQQNLNIPLGVRADQPQRAFWMKRKKDCSKAVKVKYQGRDSGLLEAALSDTQDKLQYFNDIGVNYSTLRTRLCKMVAGSVPSQAAGLDQLDVLLITNYDTNKNFQKDQLAAIRERVNRGGVLILGTGKPEAATIYMIFWKMIWNGKTPVFLGEIPIDMGEGYLFSKTEGSKVLLECNDINLSEGNVLMESGRDFPSHISGQRKRDHCGSSI